MHIQVCAALGCIGQSWMRGTAIGWAEERAVYCAVYCAVRGGLGGGGGGLSISSALPHSTSVVSRTSGWAEHHSIHGDSILQMTPLHGGEGGKKKTKCWGEKRGSADEERLRGDEKRGVRVGSERNWVNIVACLRTTAAVLNLGLSGQPSAKRWAREAREQRRKVIWRADLITLDQQGWEPWDPLRQQIKLCTGKVPLDPRSEPASSEEWRKRTKQASYLVGSQKVRPHTGTPTTAKQTSCRPFPKSPPVLPRTCLLLVNVFSARARTARQLNTLMVDAKGRNMKCLTFFLMLPESVKSKSSKSSKKGNASGGSKLPPVCYEIITLRSKKKKKMAADIFPTKKPASTTTVQQYQQQNLNNNNTIQNCNWQGLYSTIRERWVQPASLSLNQELFLLPPAVFINLAFREDKFEVIIGKFQKVQ